MSSDLKIIRVTRAELAGGGSIAGIEDPANLSLTSPHVIRALLSNPFNQAGELPVQLLGMKGSRVIGRLDLYAGRASVRNTPQLVAWGSGLYVDPEFRSTKMGIMLLGELAKLGDIAGGCGIAQIALPLYKLLNFTDLRMRRYILLRRSRAVVERYVGVGAAGSAVRIAADISLLAHRGMMRGWMALKDSGLRCQAATTMDESLSEALLAEDKPAFFQRSPAWVNWAISYDTSSQPGSRRGLFLIRDKHDSLLAYFMIRKKFHPVATQREFKNLTLGTLGDFKIFKPDQLGISTLILFACRELGRWDVDAIEVCSAEPVIGRTLRRMGFIPAGELHLMFKARKDSPAASPEFKEVSNWRISPADGDNFLE
jgi:hypothetical protein